MMNRISNRLTARFVAIAAVLALVMAAPAVFAAEYIDYEEGGTEPVATFSATDADGDAIVWSLSGADAKFFTIDGGVLAFKSSPNYEDPEDEGSDNIYNVTVGASGGSTDVVVTVTNKDEMGSVSLTDLQPQAGEPVTANVTDQDSSSLDQVRWQWSKSMDEATWEDISGGTSPTYTPKDGDIDYYLRATATYSDGLGTERDSASAVTAFAVEERPVANAQPAFADDDSDTDGAQQDRPVRETAKAGDSVGNAVTASDSDNDPLLYTLDGGDAITLTGTGSPSVDADDLFTIDRLSGQISVKSGANTDYFDRETFTTSGTLGAADAELEYTVTVTAEDPSGSQGTVTVTIEVTAVDEAATIAVADAPLAADVTITRTGDEFVVTTPEEADLALTADPGGTNAFASGLPVFDADDPEDAAEAGIFWSISGPDARRFEIRKIDANSANDGLDDVDSSAALRWSSADRDGPSFEAMDSADGDNVYEVTVTVFDGAASKSQAVSITVNNVEEPGSIKLSQRVPQAGRAITASLSDPDGGITGAEWQWYRAVTDPTSLPTTECDDPTPTTAGTPCLIDGATSSTYTPTAADAGAGNTLTVVVTYTDAFVTDADDGDTANATSDGDAQARPDANAAPTFGDDESVEREVAENANKANVGEPVTATDSDPAPRNLLMYSLSGDGSDAFSVNNDGQITTAKALDYETQSSYSITLTATDPSGASDSITVNITVTDADDPATISTTSSVSYAENGTGSVATFTATDADGDAIVWSLSGADAKFFTIDGGVLAFKSSPNYESAKDEGSDNVYNVTVRASGGSTDVMVTVTNVDEMGSVSLTDLQPQAGEPVTANVTDQDSSSLDQVRWQWSKSMDEATWEDISGGTSPTYTPKDGDIDYYLRATATYSDGLGTERDSASAMTAFAVEERPVANAQPAFADDDSDTDGAQQDRPVRETAKAGDSVGNAVTASDSDNDPLLYTLDGGDAITLTGTGSPSVDADDLFTIDRLSGQISVKSGANTDYFDRETFTTSGTLGAADAELEYTVTVTAEDPSGSQGTVTVTIEVTAVDEAATIAVADAPLAADVTITRTGDEFVVTTPEEADLALTADPGGTNTFASGLPVFDADDPEDAAEADIFWSISGPDARRFEIRKIDANSANDGLDDVDSSAALRWSSADRDGPSFEAMDSADGDNVYEVTVTVFDGAASKSQAVSITVNNVEEPGSIKLSQRVPQAGRAITASLSDPDGGITGAEWQWYRAVTDPTSLPTTECDDPTPTTAGTPCLIDGATSSTYTPTAADAGAGNTLTVVVTYTDAFVTDADDNDVDDGDTANATSDGDAQARPDANAAPTFGDDESVEREVAENANKANVGEPVTATDSDPAPRNLLMYSLSGDGSDAFSVNNDGQITTAKALDYETQSSYSITLTATDPSGASDSITVNITVTDADDGAKVILLTGNAPEFDAEEMTRSVAENTAAGMAIGDPVAATDVDGDTLTYTLGGDDADAFTIDSMGQLMTSAALDYETQMSYTVTVTASSGKADEVDAMTTVTIMVTDEGLDNAYDLNENGAIERDEVVAAIQDYLGGNTSRSEVTALIRLYFGEDG